MNVWVNPWISAGDIVKVEGRDGRYRVLRSWPTGKHNPPFTFELKNLLAPWETLLNIHPMECKRCDD